ncbi:MAG: DNA repair protein RadC [Prevotellaceae bacterium]|jgi:DNA repair protein RadC|nr:DNA repair protein RadC [Prevotellaceae bacterium]
MKQENRRLSIKSWAAEDRPRERMLEKGQAELSNAELLAILIGSGTKSLSAVDLAKIILENADNDLNKLGKFSIHDLCKIKGIGKARAVSISAALELGRRRREAEKPPVETIITPNDVYELFAPRLSELEYEELWMIYLSPSKTVLAKDCIGKGGVDKVVADIKMITRNALNNLASAVIVVHNHPSGVAKPSKEDLTLTTKLKTAFNYFDIELIDHVIITQTTYCSLANEGLI